MQKFWEISNREQT